MSKITAEEARKQFEEEVLSIFDNLEREIRKGLRKDSLRLFPEEKSDEEEHGTYIARNGRA